MVALESKEIFLELSQICEQYKKEVPSARGAWPESIKSRVLELRSLGTSYKEISLKTGIAVQTLYTWKKRSSFLPVKVVEEKAPTVTVRNKSKRQQKSKTPTVIVVTPLGYRIEGLDAQWALEFISSLERK